MLQQSNWSNARLHRYGFSGTLFLWEIITSQRKKADWQKHIYHAYFLFLLSEVLALSFIFNIGEQLRNTWLFQTFHEHCFFSFAILLNALIRLTKTLNQTFGKEAIAEVLNSIIDSSPSLKFTKFFKFSGDGSHSL